MLTDMKENMEAEYKLLRLAAKDETKSQAERDAAKDEIRRVAAAMVQVRQDKVVTDQYSAMIWRQVPYQMEWRQCFF
ncbi:MAG: hypothetical protein HON23_02305 [Rickettsiales bacterium]|nr:hypothetical protein [Rickettsiales bacterium]